MIKDAGTIYDDLLDRLENAETLDEVHQLISEIVEASDMSEQEAVDLINSAVRKREFLRQIKERGGEVEDYLIENEEGELKDLGFYEARAYNPETGEEVTIKELDNFDESKLKGFMKAIRRTISMQLGPEEAKKFLPAVALIDLESDEVTKEWIGNPDGTIEFKKTNVKPINEEPPVEEGPTPSEPEQQEEQLIADDFAYPLADDIVDTVNRYLDDGKPIKTIENVKCEDCDAEADVQIIYNNGKIDVRVIVYLPDRYERDFNLEVLKLMEPELNEAFNSRTVKLTYDPNVGGIIEVKN